MAKKASDEQALPKKGVPFNCQGMMYPAGDSFVLLLKIPAAAVGAAVAQGLGVSLGVGPTKPEGKSGSEAAS